MTLSEISTTEIIRNYRIPEIISYPIQNRNNIGYTTGVKKYL